MNLVWTEKRPVTSDAEPTRSEPGSGVVLPSGPTTDADSRPVAGSVVPSRSASPGRKPTGRTRASCGPGGSAVRRSSRAPSRSRSTTVQREPSCSAQAIREPSADTAMAAGRRRLVEDTEVGVEDLHGAPAAVVGERDADPALDVRRQLVVEAGEGDGLAVDGQARLVDVDEGHGELGADGRAERVDADGPGDAGCGRLGRGRDVAPRGRPDHAGADRDGDRQDGGDRGAGHRRRGGAGSDGRACGRR